MRVMGWACVALLAGTLAARTGNTGTDAAHKHAWGENVGWLKLKGTAPDYGVRLMAFYTQPQGTPDWWLDDHGVTESHDAGDGVPAWQKYVMDTDPNVGANGVGPSHFT